jgi:hypothetical protein
MAAGDIFTAGELAFRKTIIAKDRLLRSFLAEQRFDETATPHEWLAYLTGIKDAIGNISNDVAFVATLLIKDYLRRRFGIMNFDAGAKAQGASGLDIEARTTDGLIVIGELKTTKPYQPGFGAQQRTQILKDLDRLQRTKADHRIMFVTDASAFRTLRSRNFAARAPDVEFVELVTGANSQADPRE